MSGIERWFPRLTLAVAGAHALTAVVVHRRTYRRMWSEGVVGTADGRPEVEAAVWFGAAAPALAGLALASRWAVAETGRIPRPVPLTLVGLGGVIAAVSPISGGWALVGLGAAGLLGDRRQAGGSRAGSRNSR